MNTQATKARAIAREQRGARRAGNSKIAAFHQMLESDPRFASTRSLCRRIGIPIVGRAAAKARAAAVRAREDLVLDALRPDLEKHRARKLGQTLGAQFLRDPDALARARGLRVDYLPADQLQTHRPDGKVIDGRYIQGFKTIQLFAGFGERQRRETLAHEIAHDLGFDADLPGNVDHAACDAFAQAFLNAQLPETPAEVWRRMQDEQYKRAVREARRRG